MDRKFYSNLPVHARYLDDQGILEHLSNAIQRQIDNYQRKVGALQYFQNPDTAPAEWLYYMQQWVGGYSTPDRYLGTGINPQWSEERMRRFLMWAWEYWQRKGTQGAIREAIWVWLDFEKALDPKTLEFIRPLGTGAQLDQSRWFGYDTLFDANVTKTHLEKCFLGGGDYPQTYQPKGKILFVDKSRWEYETQWWTEKDSLLSRSRISDEESRSRLGPRNVWINAHVESDTEWNKLSPDIHDLNPEIWPVLARPVVWLSMEGADQNALLPVPYDVPTLEKPITYEIDGFQYIDVFPRLSNLETTEEVTETYLWQPSPIFEYGDTWAGVGGQLIPVEARSELTEVVTEYQNWGTTKTESGFIIAGAQYGDLFFAGQDTSQNVTIRQVTGGSASYLDSIPFVWSFASTIEERTSSTSDAGFATPWSLSEFYIKTLKLTPIAGAPEVTEPVAGDLWWVNAQEITRTTVTTHPVEIPNWGVVTKIELPGEEIEIPGSPATESNYRLRLASAGSVVVDVEGQVGSVGTGYADPLLPLNRLPDLSTDEVLQWPATAPWQNEALTEALKGSLPVVESTSFLISGSSIAIIGNLLFGSDYYKATDYYFFDEIPSSLDIDLYLDTSNRNPININSLDQWQYPAIADKQEVEVIPEYLKEIAPHLAATHKSQYLQGHEWIHQGSPSTPSRFEVVPIIKEVTLLGIPALFSRREAINVQENEIQDTRSLATQFPLLEKIADAAAWSLFLETRNGLLKLEEADNFFVTNSAGERSLQISPASGFIYLNLEFITRIYEDNIISSASLHLDSFGVVKWNEFYAPLICHRENRIGFNFKIKINLDKEV